jgi:hypothetical protein
MKKKADEHLATGICDIILSHFVLNLTKAAQE